MVRDATATVAVAEAATTTKTTTIAGEVKQQSIKVSDYRRGTPECLLPMPIKWWVGNQTTGRQAVNPRPTCPPTHSSFLPVPHTFSLMPLSIHAAHDEDALCCKLKAGRPIIEPTADQVELHTGQDVATPSPYLTLFFSISPSLWEQLKAARQM